MQSFYETLKCELYCSHTYRSYEELKKDMDDYITFAIRTIICTFAYDDYLHFFNMTLYALLI
ncbi:IS3 family transposase [Paenibacillus ihumii]|uniref:IS3 family transposase n=1 Tax=Paenibacillus ihumii TaxID=687436 RepID=UPI0011DD4C7E